MNIIEKYINLNVSQPNDFELVCAMQNNNDTLKIIAKLYDTNIPYIMDETVSRVMLQGVTPCGMAILKEITDYTASTASFLLSDNMLAVDGDLKLSIVITANSSISDNVSNQIISTFPFKIRVVHAPVGEIQESEFDSITKYVLKAEQHAKESESYSLLSKNCAVLSESYAIGGTNTRENEDNDNAKKYKEDAQSYADDASLSEQNAKASEEQAKASETNAFNSAADASASSDTAKQKAVEASASATNAANSAQLSETKAEETSASATDAGIKAAESADSAILSESYAVGGTNTRENENIDNSKYYYEQSKSISESFSGSLRPIGTVSFSSLPPIASVSDGDMYNISDEFATTADFKEGSGNIIPAGSNIYKTADGKWDILAGTPVTGIKGNAESTYRKGNVNITPDDIGAQPELGFTPVQQGGGVGQLTNKIYIGWSSSEGYVLKAQVDSTDMGGIVTTGEHNKAILPVSKGGTGATDAATARNNLGITVDNIGALPKDGTADKSNAFHVPRVSKNPSYSPGVYTAVLEEFQSNCEGLPSNHYYHILTSQGGDHNYEVQLAIGMTVDDMFFRNRKAGTWGNWIKLMHSENAVPKSGGKFTGAVSFGDRVQVWSDNEGGNIRLNSPNSNNTYYEMDVLGGNLRIYKMTEGNYSNPFTLTNDTLSVNNLYTTGQSQINNMLITQVNDNEAVSFKMGAKNNTNNASYPCLWFRQFSNTFQFFPTNNNGDVCIGHQSYKFAWVYANNIYNSSGVITTSDKNKKHDIKDLKSDFAEKIIDGLHTKSFKYNDGSSGRTHFGIIAQDLEKLLEELGISLTDFAPLVKDYPDKEVEIGKDDNGEPIIELQKDYGAEPTYNVRYEEFIMILVKYCQGLKEENLKLREHFNALEKRLEALENKINQRS